MEHEKEFKEVEKILNKVYEGRNYWYEPELINETIKAMKLVCDSMYWKTRCELAESYIENSPCDPDITKHQWEAYVKWKNVKSQECKSEK